MTARASGEAIVRRVLHADPAPIGWAGSLSYLRHRFGSGRAAARQLGVSESTLRRWSSGASNPKPANMDRVVQAVRELRTRITTMGDPGVMIHTVANDRKRGRRERDVSGRQMQLAQGTVQAMKDAWIATGDPETVYRVFVNGVQEPWYKANLTPREWRDDKFRAWVEGLDLDLGAILESDYEMSVA